VVSRCVTRNQKLGRWCRRGKARIGVVIGQARHRAGSRGARSFWVRWTPLWAVVQPLDNLSGASLICSCQSPVVLFFSWGTVNFVGVRLLWYSQVLPVCIYICRRRLRVWCLLYFGASSASNHAQETKDKIRNKINSVPFQIHRQTPPGQIPARLTQARAMHVMVSWAMQTRIRRGPRVVSRFRLPVRI
jgi:hypothetical protein